MFLIFVKIKHFCKCCTPSKYPYFHLVVGLAWSSDPESCAGNSDAAGMTSRAKQVKGDDPDKKEYPTPPSSGLGVRLTVSPF